MLCRLRRHNMKEKRIVRGHLALRQGLCPIGANLRESSPPKWVMSPWRAPHVRLSLGCQASDRQGCRDALACDDHDTKNVVYAANTPESAHVYSCLGTVRHKRSKQASATIHSLSGPARASCHQEPQRTSRPTRCCSVQCTASLIACRTAVLSSSVPCPSQQECRDGGFGHGHRRTPQGLQLEQWLHAFEKQFNMPTCLIQLHDVPIAPAVLWQGRDDQDPSREIHRACLQLPLGLARFALGPPLGLLLLLLAQTQGQQTQLDPLLGHRDPDHTTPDLSSRRVQSPRATPAP